MRGQEELETSVTGELMWSANIFCAILLLKQSPQTGDKKDGVTGSRTKANEQRQGLLIFTRKSTHLIIGSRP